MAVAEAKSAPVAKRDEQLQRLDEEALQSGYSGPVLVILNYYRGSCTGMRMQGAIRPLLQEASKIN